MKSTFDTVIEYTKQGYAAFRERWHQNLNQRTTIVLLVILIPLSWFYFGVFRPPVDFPTEEIITVEAGTSVDTIAAHLEREGVIQSGWWFKNTVRLMNGDREIIAGDYQFKQPLHLFAIAERLMTGDFGLEPVRVQVPEGAMTAEIADTLDERLPRFDRDVFLEHARPLEGYLYPDTYFFPPNVEERTIIETMVQNFESNIEEIESEIAAFGKPLDDVITMASLLEREERRTRDRRMIAGVLWQRIEMDMPLQVDAAFLYFLGRTTFDLTLEDLNADSPYNTYRYNGLPPGPIGNPGLDSIRAAVTPIEHDYLFYLADRSGTTHYSETYAEHLQKKRHYLE